MRIARVGTPAGPRYCVADGADWVTIDDPFAAEPTLGGERFAQGDVPLLAPVEPRVVLGMLHNSGAADRRLEPQAFQKSARSVIGPGDAIVLDPGKGAVKGEAELALVVGRLARRVPVDKASDYILGWTIGNDVTAVEQAAQDETRTRAKCGDGFTPLGPWIETDLDALHQTIEATVDGRAAASGSSAGLAWNPFEVFAFITDHLTLGQGDVILTGSPGTAFDITGGVRAECTIPGIGTLSNPVVDYAPH